MKANEDFIAGAEWIEDMTDDFQAGREKIYSQQFRPSPYTAALLRVLEDALPGHPIEKVLDVGVGSGVLLACLGRLGARELYGVDIDQHALEVADQLLAFEQPDKRRHLLLGDMWNPIDQTLEFDVIVANLPHFPGQVAQADRPANWTGGDGRSMIDQYLQGLGRHLSQKGSAYLTHHDLIGWDHTQAVIKKAGLRAQTVVQWTVFEPPERMSAVSPDTLAQGGQSLRYYGNYAFIDVRIVKVLR